MPILCAASAVLHCVVEGDNLGLRLLRAPVDLFAINIGHGLDSTGIEVLIVDRVIVEDIGIFRNEELYVEMDLNLGGAVAGAGDQDDIDDEPNNTANLGENKGCEVLSEESLRCGGLKDG